MPIMSTSQQSGGKRRECIYLPRFPALTSCPASITGDATLGDAEAKLESKLAQASHLLLLLDAEQTPLPAHQADCHIL